MKSEFVSIDPLKLTENPFKLIGKDWMLITAGDKKSFNTMTASWGSIGVLWNKNAATVYVRPTRHTFGFLEKNDYYTLSFFEEKYRKALNFCGANSGKNCDKVKETGLTPVESDNGVYFKEARLILECKKIFYSDFDPKKFLDTKADKTYYPLKDYHRMYIGEIVECLKKNN